VISPLTFLQIYQSTDSVMQALLEQDATFQQWFLSPFPWRPLGRFLVVPLYYHFATSGYGALVNDSVVGWLYLRGWHQVMYIEVVATHPDWRRQGVATSLLRFAERQARNLNRQWIALTVTLDNLAAVKLYEKEGYQCGHWRLLGHPDGLQAPANDEAKVTLRPVFGPAAETAFRTHTELDERAGDTWAAPAMLRLLNYDPYRLPGREWIVEVDGQPAGYLHRHEAGGHATLYLAAPPEWWHRPEMRKAVLIAASDGAQRAMPVWLRLASSGHHEAVREAFAELGFTEQPATTARMFKNLLAG
jgi:GNAT superfamily N-acetyltransferase